MKPAAKVGEKYITASIDRIILHFFLFGNRAKAL
jgi:hypothetical protein